LSLDTCLIELEDEDAPLSYSNLIELSDLVSAEMPQFIRSWNQVSSERRAQVVERLVELAEENARLDFAIVLKLALADDDYDVQEKAIAGMWEGEDRTVIPLLLNILQSDAPPPVRASAAAALGKYALLAQEDKILPKDAQAVQESLMRSLQDESDPLEVRRRALEAVSPFNTPRIQEYIRWAYGSGEQTLKGSSIYAMGKTQETAWLPAIIPELHSTHPSLRYEAVCACSELGEEDMVQHLIPLLEDDDTQVQMAAVSAMGNIGGPLAKRALRRCMRNGDESLKEAAQEALEEMEGLEI
jgi:HEAT repeat protein